MTSTTRNLSLFANEQFRMTQLQVYNWGTFSGIHTIPIAERGFLFVGRSGAGKSTLLDAFSALLVPPRWVDFNAAAREADRSGRDRNLVTYIRGAWAEQKDGDSGEIATRYLRPNTTWSAIALSYESAAQQYVTLVQVFWLRGNANGNSEVRRQYLVFERKFDLRQLSDFGQTNFDVRRLKLTFPDAFIQDEFRAYCERFSRLLGIESEMALRLLHKTQSAKNLGDLNTFLRDFMLDKPETFAVADRLVSEFDELNAAHQSVVTARDQIATLMPARTAHQTLQTHVLQRNQLNELQQGIDNYREQRRIELLKQQIATLEIEVTGVEGEISQQKGNLENHSATLRDLEQQHRNLGGDRIEQWEVEKRDAENQREERLRKRHQAEVACQQLAWTFPDTPQGFAEMVGQARQELETWQHNSTTARAEQFRLMTEKTAAETDFAQARKEITALQRQPSNIPSDMLDLRRELIAALGISETALPFIGELIEVKSDESAWQGVIERLLHGFALSLLVDEQHYTAVANYINQTNLSRRRLVYYRMGKVESWQARPISPGSVILKLNVKHGFYTDWLQNELRQHFDYTGVDSLQAFKQAERALTQEGQIKHNKKRHEKDDRHAIHDRRRWVLGFDNREKLALFEQQAQQLAQTITELGKAIEKVTEMEQQQARRVIQCQTLVNLQWQEIDPTALLNRIANLEQMLKESRAGNSALQQMQLRIEQQQQKLKKAEENLRKSLGLQENIHTQLKKYRDKLEGLQKDSAIMSLTPYQQQELDLRFAKASEKIQLDNLDLITTTIIQKLGKEVEALGHEIHVCERQIENCFADFKRQWPLEAGDMDISLASASDYFSKLNRLESDNLPAYEHRFFTLLQNQSHQNLAALSTYLNDARKAILERMELVNASLSEVPFNQTTTQQTYLHIDAKDRQLPEVKEFKQEISQALSDAWSEDRTHAEARFLTLRGLVDRLSSQNPEQKRWRESVLDVRQHVEFIGREIDESGVEVEVYRSGAGKSGGQRQKLATTCLAAALRYQLGGNDHGLPMYAPVVLDEAFDKADNEFTALAMNIFANFGFQMIVATPLKSVMTLEPFIGGACFVDIRDRQISSVLMIEYNTEQQRLNLPKQVQEAADHEIAE